MSGLAEAKTWSLEAPESPPRRHNATEAEPAARQRLNARVFKIGGLHFDGTKQDPPCRNRIEKMVNFRKCFSLFKNELLITKQILSNHAFTKSIEDSC